MLRECATPRAGWIWCDDFEQDRLSSYFEYQSDGGRFVRASGVGNEGSWGMRGRFQAGTASAGALHLAVGRTPQAYFRPVDGGTANYRELYWRMYVRTQPGWTGGAGYSAKYDRLRNQLNAPQAELEIFNSAPLAISMASLRMTR